MATWDWIKVSVKYWRLILVIAMEQQKPVSFFSRLPSIVWVIIIPIGLASLIGGIILSFWALATVEGVASILLLVCGLAAFKFTSDPIFDGVPKKAATAGGPIFLAMGIVFFALMGMSVDQPGNFIYNKFLALYYCPPNTEISRSVDVSNPLPGTTYVIQDFACVDNNKTVVKNLEMWDLAIGRFVQYVFLGYFLYYLVKAFNYFTRKKHST